MSGATIGRCRAGRAPPLRGMLNAGRVNSRLVILGPRHHVPAFLALVGNEFRIGAEFGKTARKLHYCAAMGAIRSV